MGKQRFLFDKIVRDGTISASSAAPGFPAAYIQNSLWPTFKWRATGKASEYVIIDGGASVSTMGMTIHGANFSSGVTLDLSKWSGGAWVDMDITMEYSAIRGEGIAFWTPVPSTKYKFIIADSGNSASYVEFGSWLLGDYEELSRGYEYGATEDIDDISETERSLKGFISVAEGYEEDIKAVEYEVLAADAVKLKNVWSRVKKRRPFAFIGDSGDKLNTMRLSLFCANYAEEILDDYWKRICLAWEKVRVTDVG